MAGLFIHQVLSIRSQEPIHGFDLWISLQVRRMESWPRRPFQQRDTMLSVGNLARAPWVISGMNCPLSAYPRADDSLSYGTSASQNHCGFLVPPLPTFRITIHWELWILKNLWLLFIIQRHLLPIVFCIKYIFLGTCKIKSSRDQNLIIFIG